MLQHAPSPKSATVHEVNISETATRTGMHAVHCLERTQNYVGILTLI